MNQFTVFKTLLASLPLLASLSLSGCGDKATAAKTPSEPPGVVVLAVQASDVALDAALPGRTAAYQVAEVRPQVGGLVLARQFKEGSVVKAGSPLYQIDPARYEAALLSAKAQLSKAQAQLQTAENRAQRFAELVEIDAVSKQERDDSKAALLQAQADLAAAKAAVQTAQINVDYTRVRAPITGRIGRSNASVGGLVSAGQAEPMATVLQLDPIYVDLTQSSAELLALKQALEQGRLQAKGKTVPQVKLKLEDGSVYPHTGELQFSEVNVDPGTGSVTLRALFPNPDGVLLPGMYVNALVEQGVRPGALRVPQRAVNRNNKGEPTTLVLNAEDTVELRTLKTERTLGSDWLVSSGLKAGDRVIVEGGQKVKPGAKARVVDSTATKAP